MIYYIVAKESNQRILFCFFVVAYRYIMSLVWLLLATVLDTNNASPKQRHTYSTLLRTIDFITFHILEIYFVHEDVSYDILTSRASSRFRVRVRFVQFPFFSLNNSFFLPYIDRLSQLFHNNVLAHFLDHGIVIYLTSSRSDSQQRTWCY